MLLVGLDEDLLPALIRRLTEQDDEVRILEADPELSERWRELGAHIASGATWDADLIERAAQNVRTIVVGGRSPVPRVDLLGAVVEGGRFAAREMRVVWVGASTGETMGALRESSLEFVALISPRPRLLSRKHKLAPEDLAEAIDAADDLAGHPRLELDLGAPEGWAALRLPFPEERGPGEETRQ